ncbi:MAG: arginine--tRNA ligase [Candidatus Hydrogenedentota bacterium]
MNPFESLTKPIVDAFPGVDESDLQFSAAPKLEVGDIALRTFIAAKKAKLAPPQFAAAIADRVAFGPEVLEANAAGPYLNFRLDRGAFARGIVSAILGEGGQFGSDRSGSGKTLLIEHTSINPNASPHVGRARNAMIGDSLTRLFRFTGYDVSVHYYVNDMGRQIGLLVLACDDVKKMTFDEVLDRYVEANARAEADPEFAKQGYDLLAKMEERDPEATRRFFEVTEHCLRGQLAVLGRLGIRYDHFDRESKYLTDPRLERVEAALRVKDALFVDEEDRLVVDLAKIGHTRDEGRYFVLRRANGSSLYGYRDLAYTIEKVERGAAVNLWVLGEDHKLYAEQQALILKAAGVDAPETIYYSYILLKDGKMSTRQGKVVLLSDFLDEATSLAGERVREQCAELTAEEQRAIAEKVAVAAIRFAILRVGPNKNVIFDWDASLSFSGDTGPYVQYSCARIHSILRKFGELPAGTAEEFPLEHDAEWSLLMKLTGFPEAVAGAAAQRNCAPIAQYALDTARAFTTFYHECPVLAADSPARRIARAQLCRVTLQTLANALGILGIEALERM